MDGRECTMCGEWKPATGFYANKCGVNGLSPYCKPCTRVRAKAWLAANPEKARQYKVRYEAKNREGRLAERREAARRKYAADPEKMLTYDREYRARNRDKVRAWPSQQAEHRRLGKLRRQFGVTADDLEALAERQRHQCAICQRPLLDVRIHVDHDHATGALRGLLCSRCNQGLGLFGEDPGALRRAVRYLAAPPADSAARHVSLRHSAASASP